MTTSIFDLFKIIIGPSSSHTLGPMTAGKAFVDALAENDSLRRTTRIAGTFCGSLAWTGKGHGKDKAAALGLSGEEPATIYPGNADAIFAEALKAGQINLGGSRPSTTGESSIAGTSVGASEAKIALRMTSSGEAIDAKSAS